MSLPLTAFLLCLLAAAPLAQSAPSAPAPAAPARPAPAAPSLPEVPDDLLEDEHLREEYGVNPFTTPSIRKIFAQL